MAFGKMPTTTTQAALSSNQLPVSSGQEPGQTDLTAVEMGPGSVDSNGNRTAPLSEYVKDGNDVTKGAKADSAATDNTSAWSVVALLKGILGKLLGSIAVTGTFWQSTQPVSVATLIAQAGEVALYGSNPTALTANTDAAIKWGASGTTAVNHILIANNTTINVNYRLDAATTAGSDLLAPGQKIVLDIAGTLAVHLQANGTPNVGGSSGGNIVVTGWL